MAQPDGITTFTQLKQYLESTSHNYKFINSWQSAKHSLQPALFVWQNSKIVRTDATGSIFTAQNFIKMHRQLGAHQIPHWSNSHHSLRPLVGWGRDNPSSVTTLLIVTCLYSRCRDTLPWY